MSCMTRWRQKVGPEDLRWAWAGEAVPFLLKEGLAAAMNKYN